MANERHNYKMLYDKVRELGGIPMMIKSTEMSNTIPDEKVWLVFFLVINTERYHIVPNKCPRGIAFFKQGGGGYFSQILKEKMWSDQAK